MSSELMEVLNYVYNILSQIIFLVVTIILVWGGIKLKHFLEINNLYDSFKWVVYLIWLIAFYFFAYDVVFSIISFIQNITSAATSTAQSVQ
ncbi:MAG: hypothetical protein LBC17_00415 [Lactobacillaceae bacterium]|jgi:TRAP-type C4-dicarboxylate transport system permease small subunit|nr:hypothetical protein [Lactobacillaceae bacterium]